MITHFFILFLALYFPFKYSQNIDVFIICLQWFCGYKITYNNHRHYCSSESDLTLSSVHESIMARGLHTARSAWRLETLGSRSERGVTSNRGRQVEIVTWAAQQSSSITKTRDTGNACSASNRCTSCVLSIRTQTYLLYKGQILQEIP